MGIKEDGEYIRRRRQRRGKSEGEKEQVGETNACHLDELICDMGDGTEVGSSVCELVSVCLCLCVYV